MKPLRKPLVMALVLALMPAAGLMAAGVPGEDVDARLNALESRWDQMEADIAELRALLQARGAESSPAEQRAINAVSGSVQELKQDLSGVQTELERQGAAVAAESAARQRDIAISSYGQINAIKRSGQDSLIDAESFELVFSGQPHEKISFFSELEFERAASVGAARGGEVLVEQAYVDYSFSDALALRAGVILVPFGNNEADHYAPRRDVLARPLSSRLIAPSDWTDNGFGLVGHRSLSDIWQIDWEAYLIAGLGGEMAGYGLRNARQGFGEDNNDNKAMVGHVALRQGDSLSVGLGVYRGAFDDAGQRDLSGFGLDFTWYPAPWKFTGEYLRMRGERTQADAALLHGGYLRLGYDLDSLFPENWAGAAFPDARLALIYEYDYVSAEDLTSVLSLSERERKHVVGLRYEPDHSWILKINREWSDASGPVLVNGDSDAWLFGVGFVF